MGIYDRDYYRESGRGFLDAVLPEGRICKILIGVQVVLFVLVAMVRLPIAEHLVLQPQAFAAGEVWQPLTFSFVHLAFAPWLFLCNMLFLWWLGSDLEQMYGSAEFLAFYVLAAVLGGLAFVGLAFLMGTQAQAIAFGPAGAITALLVLFACHFPSHTFRVFYLVPVPVWFLVLAQIFGSLVSTPGSIMAASL